MESVNILLVDDHEIVRDGLKFILEEGESIDTIYEACNGKECISLCEEKDKNIDIVLLDVSMPDISGVETATHIKETHLDIVFISLSIFEDQESIQKTLKAGASGYVSKKSGTNELLLAIEHIRNGKPFYSDEVASQVIKDSDEEPYQNKSPDLTKRETEILQLIVEEFTNQEIADKLYISKRTVDTHRTNLLQKTGAKNTAGLVKYALTNDLL
jgi:DNA-binding NarL/FixJ family response regulator